MDSPADKSAVPKTPSKGWLNLLKWIVLPLAFSFLAYKLLTFNQYHDLIVQWKQLSLSQFWWLGAVFLLLPINLLLEATKWKQLVSKIQVLQLTDALRGVLVGITTGFLTPNRVGELVGRVMYLNKEHRKAGITLTLLNSLTQNIIMVLCGIPACALFVNSYKEGITINASLYLWLLAAGLVLFGVVYFLLPRFSRIFNKSRYSEKIKAFTDCLSLYSKQDLVQIMLISLGRYVVFCTQFFFMLRFFRVDLSMEQALISIPTSYLFVTFTPSFAFSDVAVRSSYAVLVIGVFSNQVVSIALAGACIWLVNFVIPLFVGLVVLARGKK